jgi:hypothetical protein
MLPGVSVSLRRTSCLPAMHPASTILHRGRTTWSPAPPRVGSAAGTPVHGQFVHGLDPWICCTTPGLHIPDDGLATFVNVDMLDFDRLLRTAPVTLERLHLIREGPHQLIESLSFPCRGCQNCSPLCPCNGP